MSAAGEKIKRFSVNDVLARKGGTPLVSLTAYTAPMARLLDPHCDFLLVGDSLGMVVYGMDTTLSVTLDMMIRHGAAVVRASRRAMVVVDMPFGTTGEGPGVTFRHAARLLAESGAQAVKIEGGEEMAETVEYLVLRGIPVMGHIGLRPQMVNVMGGYRTQGRDARAAEQIVADARALENAGAFSIVIEGTVAALAREITRTVTVPTIGIGASVECDGQILVAEDLLGLFTEFTPRFVRQYASLAGEVDRAVAAYADDVKNRRFPGTAEMVAPL
ncbi:3-methyl-2-oxobutanoate hydroxymethyltransferase [Phaeovibrio sulfidiphilus]|uniref:3-methyl-2-oxobutanoate hydroxymethyltransferase n=1 Tax=Phaeovibrio sulfidiphilus TaxID=1220600 RepID=A0A8J6YKI1_9PROT|nr:3-methyl-2-oxobutanoate hydroxymethyltransferase [Phaeovibrio sulfidiphilus]MBE1236073.1 3-methyl-2-oxobutanoate hydroxymethyltransferase [Phaeovibrio sulfidiphilus]